METNYLEFYREMVLKIVKNDIERAEKMVIYTNEFEDKTAVGRWKIVVFELKCLYKKIDAAFEMLHEGVLSSNIENKLDDLDKKLFMEGP